jgi:uncharacterized protein YndB with AHSA1/START domain
VRTLTVTRSIPAPPERVFDLISDHAEYVRFLGIRRSELLREGGRPRTASGRFAGCWIWARTLRRGFQRVLEDADRILAGESSAA